MKNILFFKKLMLNYRKEVIDKKGDSDLAQFDDLKIDRDFSQRTLKVKKCECWKRLQLSSIIRQM